jgi:hypothetical protein
MTDRHDDWFPDPAWLSAYADGELTDQPELRRKIEDWLRDHPEGRAELANYRQIDELWRDTTPPAPPASAWAPTESRLRQRPARRRLPLGRAVAGLATAACLALLLGWGLTPRAQRVVEHAIHTMPPAPVEDVEVFPVATADEIIVLRVEGADTNTVAVGTLPVHGPLELAGPGDVALTSVQPDSRDRMVPRVRMGGNQRPMIWAPVDAEATEP